MFVEVIFEVAVSFFAVFGVYSVLAEIRALALRTAKVQKGMPARAFVCRSAAELVRFLSTPGFADLYKETRIFIVIDGAVQESEKEKIYDLCSQYCLECAHKVNLRRE